MKKKLITIFIFIFMLFTFTSCSGADDEAILIESISSEVLSDGRTQVTIKYLNEELKDSIFYLPKGQDGTGISDFVYKINDEKNTTDITFSFTDGLNDYTVSVPNGKGIANILYTPDNDGNTVMTFVFTDGTNSDPILVNRGLTGTSVTGFESIVHDDESVEIIIKYSDGSEYNAATLPAPQKGDDGRGIETILGSTDSYGNYTLVFTYTDGESSEPVVFNRPNTILHGTNPPAYRLGLNGDLYYDESTKTFYYKQDDTWVSIFRFDNSIHRCSVKFVVDADTTLNGAQEIQIIENTAFATSGYTIPIPTKEGFKFEGWYFVNNPDPRINGKFLDTTVVYENIKLYPLFVEE